MSRITHFKQQIMNIDFWDYYILCHLEIDAARILQRLEYWDGTKDDGNVHAEATNDQLEVVGKEPTQDTSRFIFKAEEEFYWELMGSCGEKNIPKLLRFLSDDLKYVIIRNNPYKSFDRMKQYEFQATPIQEHIDKLYGIIKAFTLGGRRLRPVQYAIECLTREAVYIDTLSIEKVTEKLTWLHTQTATDEVNCKYEKGKKPIKSVIPRFIRAEIKKDEKLGFSAETPFRKTTECIPQNDGNDTGKTTETIPQNGGLDSGNLGGAIPVITNSDYLTVITEEESVCSALPTEPPAESLPPRDTHTFENSSPSSSEQGDSHGLAHSLPGSRVAPTPPLPGDTGNEIPPPEAIAAETTAQFSTHTPFENSSLEEEQGEQDGSLHSHSNHGGNEHSNQPMLHTLHPAPDTHGATSDERRQAAQAPLAETTSTTPQARSADSAASTPAPRTPSSPSVSPSGVRGAPLQDHNRVGSPPADDKSHTNTPVLSKQENAVRRKWAKYVSEDIPRETVIIALQLRSRWIEAYGAYGDAEWDNQAILWLAQQDNGTWENIQKVVERWAKVKPGESIHPEMVKNKWFWANGKPQKQPNEVGGRQLGVSGLPKFT